MSDVSTCPNEQEEGFDLYVVRRSGQTTVWGAIHQVRERIDTFLAALLTRIEATVEEAAMLQSDQQDSEDVIVVEYGHDGQDQALFHVLDPRRVLASVDRWENWLVTALVKLWQAFDVSDRSTAFRLVGKESTSIELRSAA